MKHKKKDIAAQNGDAPATFAGEQYREPTIPLFLCLLCMTLALIACVIDAFVYPFGNDLLAPVVLELLAIVFPCYLLLMSIYPKQSPAEQMRLVGFRLIKARYIFFLLFSALFMISASLLVSIISGGVYSAAEGFTLLGTFTAGENDFTVSWPYLILAYALVPAVAEELLLRGMVMSRLGGVGFAAAATVSAVMSALLGMSVGGAVTAVFAALVSCFVLYTTGSLWACILVRMFFNLYRLFLESNISQYYISSSQNGLLLVVLLVVILISGALFFAESARLYREDSERVTEGAVPGKTLSLKTFKSDIKKILSYRPTVIIIGLCVLIFAAVAVIGYFD